MTPDDVTFCRRMVDLALSSPADPASRDALIWVLNKPYRADYKEYGDEFARAAALLVRHHGDDPEAVRIGLGMTNSLSPRRDAFLLGFLASARGREARGLARWRWPSTSKSRPRLVPGKGPLRQRRKIKYIGIDRTTTARPSIKRSRWTTSSTLDELYHPPVRLECHSCRGRTALRGGDRRIRGHPLHHRPRFATWRPC